MAQDGVTFLPDPKSLVSTWRRFGVFGPPYRIDGIVELPEDGDALFRVVVPGPRGDEIVERRFSEVLADPTEG